MSAPAAPTGVPALPAQRSADAPLEARLEARLAALLPPAPALDLATAATGLADGPARESVARLLAQG